MEIKLEYCDKCGVYLRVRIGEKLFKFGKEITGEHVCEIKDEIEENKICPTLKGVCFLCGKEIKPCEESLWYFWDTADNIFILHKECKHKLREYEKDYKK